MASPTPRNPALNNMDEFLSSAHKRRHSRGSTIIFAGDVSDSIFYITKGSVSVIIEDDNGREIIVSYLNEGEFFGEIAMLGKGPRTAWVKAKTECEVAELGYQKFIELSQRDTSILHRLVTQLAERLGKTTQKVGDLAFLDVTGRVARALLELSTEPDAMTHPDGMQIKITRQEIGRIVGCSREMVGRVLKTLEEQGLVTVKGKTMVVLGAR
ncbi:MAG: cAMP-activated global transcriptional regulator CRP [Gammaproteobacteria bacterium]|nr:cAMP-activated global transcriptional regulator CRP [Gammaproteobacteria bacterium]MDG1231598.1 cAMP-activated global transcriptional regulator CRP [Pseudomonadales bacterium]